MTLQSSRPIQITSMMAATLQGEAKKEANCFKINGTGKIEEGLTLEFAHPKTFGKTALFIDNFFILRNDRNGVAHDENGRVRRASIEYLNRPGKVPLALLTQPNDPNPPMLLHIDITLPNGVKPKKQFWAGVDTEEEIIAQSGPETLVSLKRDGASADIFYADGSVKRVVRQKNGLIVENLTLEQQAERRIEIAQFYYYSADRFSGSRRTSQEDFGLHQLIAIMAVGGRRSNTIFDTVYTLLVNIAKSGDMRPGVRIHAKEVIETSFPEHRMEFEDLSLASKFADHAPVPLFDSRSAVRTLPSERKAYIAERSGKDRQARQSMRGSSEDKSLKGKSASKKK